VSGQLFVSDVTFRKSVNALLPASYKLADFRPRPDASAFRIVFAIVSAEKGKTLTLPFFSRLNARHAVQAMQGYGYRVELTKIRVDDAVAKMKKFTKPKRKKAA